MRYPFLPDFHAAALVKAGSELRTAMWLPGACLFTSCIALLFLLNRRIFATVRGSFGNMEGVLSTALVVFSGGYGGIQLMLAEGVGSITGGRFDPIQDVPGSPGTTVWFGFLAHVMLPQRGATFAYPLVLFVVLAVWVALKGRAKLAASEYRALVVASGICAGSLPLIQVTWASLWLPCVKSREGKA